VERLPFIKLWALGYEVAEIWWSAGKEIVPYHSIRAHIFLPTFENSPKIEFFEFCHEIGINQSSKLPLSILKSKKMLSCFIRVQESIEKTSIFTVLKI